MSFIACDIAILPSEDLCVQAIETSQRFQKRDALFTLHAEACVPHVSLYMVRLDTDGLNAARELLAKIAATTSAQNITAKRYYQSEGYTGVEYVRSDELAKLQMTVVQAINPIRDRTYAKNKADAVSNPDLARENVKQYGYPNIGELFWPHITFTRFSDQEEKALELPPLQVFNGQLIRLGLFELGKHGTCIRRIAEFPLTFRKR